MYNHKQIQRNLRARGVDQYIHGEDGGRGVFQYRQTTFRFQYSFGEGWEHLSVSTAKRCPTWEEMCMFKDFFWPLNEACIQYHPAQTEYINNHQFCLHIWRPINETIPTPPRYMVGI